jgi:hypothetical protein
VVVVIEPRGKCCGAFAVVGEGPAVGPLGLQRAVEPLDLSVGPGTAWFDERLLSADRRDSVLEHGRLSVGHGVVGQNAFDVLDGWSAIQREARVRNAACLYDLVPARPRARHPPPSGIRPTFLTSMWISSPGAVSFVADRAGPVGTDDSSGERVTADQWGHALTGQHPRTVRGGTPVPAATPAGPHRAAVRTGPTIRSRLVRGTETAIGGHPDARHPVNCHVRDRARRKDSGDQQQPAMNSQRSISVGHEDLRTSGDLDISTNPGGPLQIKTRTVTNVLAVHT